MHKSLLWFNSRFQQVGSSCLIPQNWLQSEHLYPFLYYKYSISHFKRKCTKTTINMSAVKLISGNVSGWCGPCGCNWFEYWHATQKKQSSGLTIIQDGEQSNKWSQHLLLTAVSARAVFVLSSTGRPLLFSVCNSFAAVRPLESKGGDILFLQWDLLGGVEPACKTAQSRHSLFWEIKLKCSYNKYLR